MFPMFKLTQPNNTHTDLLFLDRMFAYTDDSSTYLPTSSPHKQGFRIKIKKFIVTLIKQYFIQFRLEG